MRGTQAMTVAQPGWFYVIPGHMDQYEIVAWAAIADPSEDPEYQYVGVFINPADGTLWRTKNGEGRIMRYGEGDR